MVQPFLGHVRGGLGVMAQPPQSFGGMPLARNAPGRRVEDGERFGSVQTFYVKRRIFFVNGNLPRMDLGRLAPGRAAQDPGRLRQFWT